MMSKPDLTRFKQVQVMVFGYQGYRFSLYFYFCRLHRFMLDVEVLHVVS